MKVWDSKSTDRVLGLNFSGASPHPITRLTEPPVCTSRITRRLRYLDHENEITRYRAAVQEIQRRALVERASRQLLGAISRKHHR